MAASFKEFAVEGDHYLAELAKALGLGTDTQRAYRMLRSVLHVLRDHLSTEESLQLLAQLPIVLKGLYVEGWTGATQHHAKTRDLFIGRLIKEDPAWLADFPDEAEAERAISIVIRSLQRYVSIGELKDIIAQLPDQVKIFALAGLPDTEI
jgi:uncharacterized protein (DUF2267 family)